MGPLMKKSAICSRDPNKWAIGAREFKGVARCCLVVKEHSKDNFKVLDVDLESEI